MSGRSRTVKYVLVYQGEDQVLMDQAQARVMLAEAEADNTLARTGGDGVEEAEQARDEIEAAAAERADRLYMGVLDRHHWRWLGTKFPPRPDNKFDELQGWNDDEFPDALVASCLVDGEQADWLHRDEWESALRSGMDRLDEMRLSESELTAAFRKALDLCAGATDPKERRQRAFPI